VSGGGLGARDCAHNMRQTCGAFGPTHVSDFFAQSRPPAPLRSQFCAILLFCIILFIGSPGGVDSPYHRVSEVLLSWYRDALEANRTRSDMISKGSRLTFGGPSIIGIPGPRVPDNPPPLVQHPPKKQKPYQFIGFGAIQGPKPYMFHRVWCHPWPQTL
jgi:hypothetical protein